MVIWPLRARHARRSGSTRSSSFPQVTHPISRTAVWRRPKTAMRWSAWPSPQTLPRHLGCGNPSARQVLLHRHHSPATTRAWRADPALFLIGLDAFLDFPSWRTPDIAETLLVRHPLPARPVVSFPLNRRAASADSLSLAGGPRCRTDFTNRGTARNATPDLSQTTTLLGLRIGHSLTNPPRASGGKSVAALSGILYTSTSSLPRGR